jgi:hypothetical protein
VREGGAKRRDALLPTPGGVVACSRAWGHRGLCEIGDLGRGLDGVGVRVGGVELLWGGRVLGEG